MVRRALATPGYTVLDAEGFSQAVSIFDENVDKIDLLIADVSLPDGNGCDLALALWRQKNALRALFISGHVGSEVCRFYGLDVQDVHFLRKPFSSTQLVERVQEILASAEGFPKLLAPVRPKASTSA